MEIHRPPHMQDMVLISRVFNFDLQIYLFAIQVFGKHVSNEYILLQSDDPKMPPNHAQLLPLNAATETSTKALNALDIDNVELVTSFGAQTI